MLSVLQLDHIELLKNIHLSCNTSADDIDEPKYTLQKKLSEVFDRVTCFDGRVLNFQGLVNLRRRCRFQPRDPGYPRDLCCLG
jgi:hypothetical protein